MKFRILLLILLTITACSSIKEDNMEKTIIDDHKDLDVPERTTPDTYFCEDTDDGIDILTRGTVTSDLGVFTDTCQEDYKLREYFCDGDTADSSVRKCLQGPCIDGECTVVEEPKNCTDTDGGSFFEKKGIATGVNGDSKTDYCEENILYEAYCDKYQLSKYKTSECAVCEDGVCVQKEVSDEVESCMDSDGGSNYDVRGNTTDTFGNEGIDSCITDKILEEYYCNSYGIVDSKLTNCACEEGVCTGSI